MLSCAGDESAVASAKAAMDDCLESDPYTDAYTDAYTDGPADVCGCMDKFEAYEAALDKCGEEPSDAYEETFEDACKEDGNDDDGGNDDTCTWPSRAWTQARVRHHVRRSRRHSDSPTLCLAGDGFLVESLALAAWKCMGSNIACTCKDKVVAYNTALEACGSDKDQTLVQLVTASCGTQADTAPAIRAALCTDCPSADVLDTDPACMVRRCAAMWCVLCAAPGVQWPALTPPWYVACALSPPPTPTAAHTPALPSAVPASLRQSTAAMRMTAPVARVRTAPPRLQTRVCCSRLPRPVQTL